eukprot:CAMPEP_0115844884 /NCGR_PEP_ID=MMETSP0287-20121206/9058_1 /TAXON_ID=412157 /ORGANISM="Chrysochromulina rotalis, Strain UIO044" /LENGTH=138 /DNA_ID=CAMNT_0003298623 /DNA_START=521 /DNA_END=934 /DNA_ORIENTATION=-
MAPVDGKSREVRMTAWATRRRLGLSRRVLRNPSPAGPNPEDMAVVHELRCIGASAKQPLLASMETRIERRSANGRLAAHILAEACCWCGIHADDVVGSIDLAAERRVDQRTRRAHHGTVLTAAEQGITRLVTRYRLLP